MGARKKSAIDPEEVERAFHARVGHAVRSARKLRSWTQADLAEHAGLSSNYVARLERGEVAASLWVAFRLATALGIGLDALLENAPRPPPLARTKHAKRRAERYEL